MKQHVYHPIEKTHPSLFSFTTWSVSLITEQQVTVQCLTDAVEQPRWADTPWHLTSSDWSKRQSLSFFQKCKIACFRTLHVLFQKRSWGHLEGNTLQGEEVLAECRILMWCRTAPKLLRCCLYDSGIAKNNWGEENRNRRYPWRIWPSCVGCLQRASCWNPDNVADKLCCWTPPPPASDLSKN